MGKKKSQSHIGKCGNSLSAFTQCCVSNSSSSSSETVWRRKYIQSPWTSPRDRLFNLHVEVLKYHMRWAEQQIACSMWMFSMFVCFSAVIHGWHDGLPSVRYCICCSSRQFVFPGAAILSHVYLLTRFKCNMSRTKLRKDLKDVESNMLSKYWQEKPKTVLKRKRKSGGATDLKHQFIVFSKWLYFQMANYHSCFLLFWPIKPLLRFIEILYDLNYMRLDSIYQ